MNHLKNRPLETIIHRTGDMPFLLHHTVVIAGDQQALYLHCHPEAEFFYVTGGELLFHIENNEFVLHAGDGIFIPPNLVHFAETLSLDCGCEFHASVFSLELLEKALPDSDMTFFLPIREHRMECICPLYKREPANSFLLSMLQIISTYKELPSRTYELALPGMLLVCWQELYNLYFCTLNETVNKKGGSTQISAALYPVLDYIMENYAKQITLDELAGKAGFSEGYFCRSFHTFTGLSPFEYLNRTRIIKSLDLLSGTNKKITDIASECGFNNISYYNRIFYKIMHTTPSAYRKMS